MNRRLHRANKTLHEVTPGFHSRNGRQPLTPAPRGTKTAAGSPAVEHATSAVIPCPTVWTIAQQPPAKKPLAGVVLVMVGVHLLYDLVEGVLRAWEQLGLEPNLTYLFLKPYHYDHREDSIARLRSRGFNIRVIPFGWWAHESLRERLKAELGGPLGKLLKKQRQFIVLDDGGAFWDVVNSLGLAELLGNCLGVVEQTSSGVPGEQVRCPVPYFPVGTAEAKKKAEYPWVARSAAHRVCELLDSYNTTEWKVAVLGYGELAQRFVREFQNRLPVKEMRIFDPTRTPEEGFGHAAGDVGWCENATDAVKDADLVVLGSPTVQLGDLEQLALKTGVVVINIGSELSKMVDIGKLLAKAGRAVFPPVSGDSPGVITGRRQTPIGFELHLAKHPSRIDIIFLAWGEPVNFFGAQSIPDDIADHTYAIITAIMLECALQRYRPGWHEQEIPKIYERYQIGQVWAILSAQASRKVLGR